MLIISYMVNHKNHTKPIELCGRFNSWEHFRRFQDVEASRGWFIFGIPKLLAECTNPRCIDAACKVHYK